MALYRGKGLNDLKKVIVILQAEEVVAENIFSDPETIKSIKAGDHIYRTTKIRSWLSNQMKKEFNLTQGITLLSLKPLNLPTHYILNLIIWITNPNTNIGY